MNIPTIGAGAWAASGAAKDGDGAPPASSTGGHAAWLREMEKQELASWLGNRVLPPVSAAPPVYARIEPAPGGHGDSGPAGRGADDAQLDAAQPDGAPPDGAQDGGSACASAPPAASGAPGAAVAGEGAGPAAAAQPAARAAHAGAMTAASRAQAVRSVVAPLLGRDPALRGLPYSVEVAFEPGLAALGPAALPVAAAGRNDAPEQDEPDAPNAPQPAPAPRGSAAGARGADEPAPALRIHASWSDEGVRVWIGADQAAGLTAQRLAYLMHDMKRQFKEHGAALLSLTCNGEAVLDEAGAAARGLPPRAEAMQAAAQGGAAALPAPLRTTRQS